MNLERQSQRFKRLFWRLRAIFPIQVEETPLRGASSPILIAGTGGSGTRVVTEVAKLAGFFIGRNLNVSNDAMETVQFAERWIAPSLAARHLLSGEQAKRMTEELHFALARHRVGIPNPRGPWVVKNPRLMLILPLLHSTFPALKFVHVVRDGRDIAFSKNQLQLRDFEQFILDERTLKAALPVRSIAFWSATNLAVRSFCESQLKTRYCCIRFEDLCREPLKVVERLFRFLGADGKYLEMAAAVVRPPSTIGRWRRQSAGLLAELHEAGEAGLKEFAYLQ